MKENFDWANAYLLRVDPADYAWLTNDSFSGRSPGLNMGRDPILISFDKPICAFGAIYAQAGAHNPHHPEQRRRTSFSFYDASGGLISVMDEKPGYFIVESGFQKIGMEPWIAGVMIGSEVEFAIIEIIAMPCSEMVG
jgi:hypothetical protein